MAGDLAVLVVGAGPTGLMLASELLRRGVSCRLIDAQAEALHWDRATVMHPRSIEIFESLGLLDEVLASGVKQHGARLHSEGAVLGEFELGDCGSRHGYNLGISEEVTERILTDHLHRLGGEVTRSSRLVSLDQHPEGVVANIDHDGVAEELVVDWVIVATGSTAPPGPWPVSSSSATTSPNHGRSSTPP